jgi:lipopolysaccharide export system protein LptA
MIATEDAKQPPQLDTIAGRGHTVLHQATADGIEQTSAGDTLDAKFRPKAASSGARRSATALPATEQLADTLVSEVQVGHVTMTRRVPARSQGKAVGTKAGGPAVAADDVERAIAERAAYDGDLDRMTLTGGVQLGDADSALWADQVTLDHKTGDAHAVGAVKMNYVNDASSAVAGAVRISPTQARLPGPAGGSQRTAQAEPTHILADRADLEHATEVATFYGKPVRMWQGGDQVQAPVIEFSRAQKRMIARAEAATGLSTAAQAAQVHTVLAGGGNDATGAAKPGAAKPGLGAAACDARTAAKPGVGMATADSRPPSVVRVASGGLIYSETLRRADFTGGFRAETVDGTIRAGEGTIYLRKAAGVGGADAAAGEANASAGPSLAGDLDRVVATEHVELDKPGLRATGGRLVYTASDRVALLTGDKDAQPKAVDAQGTTTGAALRFQSSCDGSGSGTVEVLGAPGERVRTDARIGNDGRKEKGKR